MYNRRHVVLLLTCFTECLLSFIPVKFFMHFTVDRIYIYTTNVDVMHAKITWQIYTYLHGVVYLFLEEFGGADFITCFFHNFVQSCYRSPS